MKNQLYIDHDRLHPNLEEQLCVVMKTTKLVALKYYPMLSYEFDSVNDFELHLQDQLFKPLSLINFMLGDAIPHDQNINEIIETTVYNYLKTYVRSDLIDFKFEEKLENNEVVIFGFKVKMCMWGNGILHLKFCGKENEVQKLVSQICGTYEPIKGEERMYGISFMDGGIS